MREEAPYGGAALIDASRNAGRGFESIPAPTPEQLFAAGLFGAACSTAAPRPRRFAVTGTAPLSKLTSRSSGACLLSVLR